MKWREVLEILSLFMLCAVLSRGQSRTIKDDLGIPYRIASPPERIVSLAPNITEILYALGLGENVVGVTRYCDYPAQAREKEKIGGMIDPNLEKIKSLQPDLTIGFRGNPLRTLERLRNIQPPVFVLEMGDNLHSVFRIIGKIGTITQREEEAEALVRSLKVKYDHIQSALHNVRRRPKVFLSLQGGSLWTCGKESYLHDLITKAKGVNIAGNIPRKWLLYNREQLVYENPDIIIILSQSRKEFVQAEEWIKKEAPFQQIKAVATDRIHLLDENLASRPGPRLIDALFELACLLHPQYFKERP